MSIVLAHLRRDFLIWSSYRLAAFFQVAGVFMTIGLIYFAGKAIGDRSALVEGEGGYIAFVIVGLAFTDLLAQGLASLPRGIQDNQRAGTLESVLMAPVAEWQLLVSCWLFRFLFSAFRTAALMMFGWLALGFWPAANPLAIVAVVVPAQAAFLAMGAFSAAFLLLVKQGDPVLLAYAAASAILGGAFFPVEALPDWMQPVTLLVPLTHALSGIREGLAGGSGADVAPQALTLTVMAALSLPLGLYAFRWAMKRAKEEGSLGEY